MQLQDQGQSKSSKQGFSNENIKQKKNFHYNARIKELCHQLQDEDSQFVNKLSQRNVRTIKKQKKDKRIAAKETRIRKKMYVELLEKKINILQRKLNQAKKARIAQTGTIGTLIKQRQELFNTLSQSIAKKQMDKTKDCIDLLQFRYGIAGKDRIKAIQQLFDQIVSLLMPMHMRMLIQLPTKFKVMCRSFPQQRLQRLQKQLKQIQLSRQRYSESLKTLDLAKKSFIKLNVFYQDVTNRIRQVLGNKQIGLMLSSIDIQRSKNKDYTRLFPMSYWNELCKHQDRQELTYKDNFLNESLDMDEIPFAQKEIQLDQLIQQQ